MILIWISGTCFGIVASLITTSSKFGGNFADGIIVGGLVATGVISAISVFKKK